MTGSDATGTGRDVTGIGSAWKGGSHVIWSGKPLTSPKNRSRAQRKKKPLRNAGAESKVHFRHRGRSLTQRKGDVRKNDVLMPDIVEQLNKSFNEALDPRSFDNPWHADDESSISQEEAEAGCCG